MKRHKGDFCEMGGDGGGDQGEGDRGKEELGRVGRLTEGKDMGKVKFGTVRMKGGGRVGGNVFWKRGGGA